MGTGMVSQKIGYRDAEVTRLFAWMRAGESASIVAASGTGKSNLFNHLGDAAIQEAYLQDEAPRTIVVRANFHYLPDFSDRSVYSLILEQLELLESQSDRLQIEPGVLERIGRSHEMLLDAGDDVLKVQRYFKLALRALLANSERRLIFLFDQFDEVYEKAEPRLFANLRGLREAYKYRLSFFTFTRDLLPNWAEIDPAQEEFYELLAANVMGLRPYNRQDSLALLERVGERNRLPLTQPVAERLLRLTGGHGGLLRTAYLHVAGNGVQLPENDGVATVVLLQAPAVKLECEKIWNSLNVAERKSLAYRARDLPMDGSNGEVERQLRLKGLLGEDGTSQIFAPLFELYVKEQDDLWEQPLYFDKAARQVWVLGRPAPALTQLEFRLFRLFHDRKGEVVVKDDLVEAGWPNAKGGVSDEAIVAAISRLRRKIEPDPREPRFLQNIHNQGYTLKVEERA